jgi:endonuclease YncB( thermonuclease family)
MILRSIIIETEALQESYREVLTRVAQILEAGKARARAAVERERLLTYWEAGGEIQRHLAGRDSHFGEQLVKNMSVDLELGERLIYDMINFRNRFRELPSCANLTWSHYRKLIPLPDEGARSYYVQQADVLGWSVRELEASIKADAYGASAWQNTQEPGVLQAPLVPRLRAKRGEPYLYRVIEKDGLALLDLGFRDFRMLSDINVTSQPRPGSLVRSRKDANQKNTYLVVPAPERRQVYAYSAKVAKIIDGDTLWARIDFGFKVLAERKLRLRGIDSPELGTPEGARARDHLAATLAEAGTFMVTTTKVDLFDRYLADLFVLPGEADPAAVAREGRYVNRELIEEGFARRWTKEKPPEF